MTLGTVDDFDFDFSKLKNLKIRAKVLASSGNRNDYERSRMEDTDNPDEQPRAMEEEGDHSYEQPEEVAGGHEDNQIKSAIQKRKKEEEKRKKEKKKSKEEKELEEEMWSHLSTISTRKFDLKDGKTSTDAAEIEIVDQSNEYYSGLVLEGFLSDKDNSSPHYEDSVGQRVWLFDVETRSYVLSSNEPVGKCRFIKDGDNDAHSREGYQFKPKNFVRFDDVRRVFEYVIRGFSENPDMPDFTYEVKKHENCLQCDCN